MQILHYSSLDSTNEEAKRLLSGGEIDGPTLVVADEQTAGRGTQGRVWLSPPGAGLYLTLVNPATEDYPLTPHYTLATGIACVEALHEATGLTVQLKPVNDLYVHGKKLGGILTESHLRANGQMTALLTGIGINIRRAERPLHDAVVQAISLEECLDEATFQKFDPQAWIPTLAARVQQWHQLVREGDTHAVELTWQMHRLPGDLMPLPI